MSDPYSKFVKSIVKLGHGRDAILLRLKSCGDLELFHVACQNKFLFQVVADMIRGRNSPPDLDEIGNVALSRNPATILLPAELKLAIADHLDLRSLRFMSEADEAFAPECTRIIETVICDAFRGVGLCWKSTQFMLSCVKAFITGEFLYHILLRSRVECFGDSFGSLIILVELEESVGAVASFIASGSEYVVNLEQEGVCNSFVTMSRPSDTFKIEIRACLCREAWVLKQRSTHLFNWLTATSLFVGYDKLTFTRRAIAGGSHDDCLVGGDTEKGVMLLEYDSDPSHLTCPAIERSSTDNECFTVAIPGGWTMAAVGERSRVYWRLGSCSHSESAARYIQVIDL
ncbi:hypothetical protein R3P38DRAFT_2780641 [Favolaschia claudopus]|uniref:F-box domain-containing protein n=1 Tax=Favolaschia claudopus TaxID=2862362 RepID=A0AAW0BAP4_9AGAR